MISCFKPSRASGSSTATSNARRTQCIDGVGGPDHDTIALTIHGPALKALHAAPASPDIARRGGRFAKAGPDAQS